ncbi:hypothetical protein M231_03750 [Tremella mesenterica]|uniref:Transmembrane protein n=1 Tax=Tremella mesenterica TaxID=5217 RepID=A0A4Q1BMR6_TREME|nr:uncharacterized protein TREMEDRAFT_64984 [Tremella mesenterica DSM 1558]EIW67115.1 hypothetical protein TREMEDRAFT_64984 [Tremella mesenterica DSM 1558]RXK39020.1 hypothetical protein M231_03750 [Tremella mesenterica]
MSANKGTYAAVVANGKSRQESSSEQGDAPPPYSGPSQPIYPAPTAHHPPLGPSSASAAEAGVPEGGWEAHNMRMARSRAIRRFWGAMFWAWVIWILVGFIIGGGVSDVSSAPMGRHGHWDNDGHWVPDPVYTYVPDDGHTTRTWRRKPSYTPLLAPVETNIVVD